VNQRQSQKHALVFLTSQTTL